MGETGVAGRGGVGELASEEAIWLLATDASGALEVVFLNILGLRISKICCCFCGGAGRLREPASAEFGLLALVLNSFLDAPLVAASFSAAARILSASDSEIVLLWLLTAMLSWSQIANSSLLSKFNSFDNS
jgi:hypothetical protein